MKRACLHYLGLNGLSIVETVGFPFCRKCDLKVSVTLNIFRHTILNQKMNTPNTKYNKNYTG